MNLSSWGLLSTPSLWVEEAVPEKQEMTHSKDLILSKTTSNDKAEESAGGYGECELSQSLPSFLLNF